jgi:RHS repeat-associated protein
MITWVFEEGSFVPAARITGDGSQSIVTDYLGTPVQMYNTKGEKTWEADLDIYGKVRTFAGRSLKDCPFRYQGQYEDNETGLYYNRFRYYSPEEGMYLSQDPIGLAGGNPTLYGYVHDPNSWVDVFGLDCAKNAKELRANMAKEGRIVGDNEAAGHIVASTGSKGAFEPAVESRALLSKYNIGINDAANGIPIGHPNPHGKMHTTEFNTNVRDRLKGVETKMQEQGYGHKATRSALRRELRLIGKETLANTV